MNLKEVVKEFPSRFILSERKCPQCGLPTYEDLENRENRPSWGSRESYHYYCLECMIQFVFEREEYTREGNRRHRHRINNIYEIKEDSGLVRRLNYLLDVRNRPPTQKESTNYIINDWLTPRPAAEPRPEVIEFHNVHDFHFYPYPPPPPQPYDIEPPSITYRSAGISTNFTPPPLVEWELGVTGIHKDIEVPDANDSIFAPPPPPRIAPYSFEELFCGTWNPALDNHEEEEYNNK